MFQYVIVSHSMSASGPHGLLLGYLVDEIDLIFPSRCQKAVSSFSLASSSSNDISGASISIALSSMICDDKNGSTVTICSLSGSRGGGCKDNTWHTILYGNDF